MTTKEILAERVLRELQADFIGRDFKIRPREVYPRLDAVVNALAKQSFFENWKMGFGTLGEQFLTTWENVTVTDQPYSQPSYLDLPVNYVDLPMNQGIYEILPLTNPDILVIITTQREYRMYRNTAAGDFEQQLAAYPIGSRLYFNKASVNQQYGNMMVRLVVRDSSIIAANQPYPIPADKEETVVRACVQWFRDRLSQGSDLVADSKLNLQ